MPRKVFLAGDTMISVVIPTKNNSPSLIECLKSIKKQSYKNIEVIIVAPKKTDLKILAEDFKVKIITDKKFTIGNAYAIGAEKANGDIVVFIDDDAFAPQDWLSQISNEFKKEEVDVVGGDDILPEKSTEFQKAAYQVDLARQITQSLYGEKAKNKLRATNIAFRKKTFSKLNFNKKLNGLQEPELLHRLLKSGHKIKYNPKIFVYHQRRSTLQSIFHQIYRNGLAKIELIKMHKELLSFEDVAPFIAIAYAVLTFSLFPIKTALIFAIFPFILYFLAKPAVILFRTKNLRYYPRLFAIILTREVAYGLGILIGMKNIFRR